MKKISIILFYLLPLFCFGQNETSKKYSLRTGLIFDYSSQGWNANPILLGLSKYDRKNNMHIIELQKLSSDRKKFITKYDPYHHSNISTYFDISLSYQYNFYLKHMDKKFRPYIGSSFVLSYFRLHTEYFDSGSYPQRNSEFTPQIAVNIGFNFNLLKNFYLDIYIPIDFLRFENIYAFYNNPNILESLRKTTDSKLLLFPFDKASIRLMLGLKF